MTTRLQAGFDRLLWLRRWPPLALAALVGVVLALPLLWLLTGGHDESAAVPHGPLRLAMAPVLIAYTIAVRPWLQGRARAAIEALRPLSRQPEIVDDAFVGSRRGAWTAAALGAALAVWISQSPSLGGWLFAYSLVTNIALLVLIALAVHDGLRRTRHLKRVVAAGLELDLFDRTLLAPLARFGQGVSMTFVGGICLSLLFQSAAMLYSLQALVIYSILVAVALTASFSSVWSIHGALLVARERELSMVRQHWRRAREEMQRHARAGSTEGDVDAAKLYEPLVILGAYERQVLEASTWPFNAKIVKQVAASVVAPALIYVIKLAAGLPG